MQLFDGKGGLVEGCIQSVSRAGLDIMAVEEPQVVPPQGIQWHVYAAFGESFYPYFSNNHTIISIIWTCVELHCFRDLERWSCRLAC